MKLVPALTLALEALTAEIPRTQERREAIHEVRALLDVLQTPAAEPVLQAIRVHRIETIKKEQAGLGQEIARVDAAPREYRNKQRAHQLHQELQALEGKIRAIESDAEEPRMSVIEKAVFAAFGDPSGTKAPGAKR